MDTIELEISAHREATGCEAEWAIVMTHTGALHHYCLAHPWVSIDIRYKSGKPDSKEVKSWES